MLVLALVLQIAASSTTEGTSLLVDCLADQVVKLEPSGEPASAIAEAAMAMCFREERGLKAAVRLQFEAHQDAEVSATAAERTEAAMSTILQRLRPMTMQLVMTLRANART